MKKALCEIRKTANTIFASQSDWFTEDKKKANVTKGQAKVLDDLWHAARSKKMYIHPFRLTVSNPGLEEVVYVEHKGKAIYIIPDGRSGLVNDLEEKMRNFYKKQKRKYLVHKSVMDEDSSHFWDAVSKPPR